MTTSLSEKSRKLLERGFQKTFRDLEVFHVGALTFGQTVEIVPSNSWLLERSNYGDFYLALDMDHAYRFMDRQVCRFWRLAYWGYQPLYGFEIEMGSPLRLRGLWMTPSDFDHHPELKEVA